MMKINVSPHFAYLDRGESPTFDIEIWEDEAKELHSVFYNCSPQKSKGILQKYVGQFEVGNLNFGFLYAKKLFLDLVK